MSCKQACIQVFADYPVFGLRSNDYVPMILTDLAWNQLRAGRRRSPTATGPGRGVAAPDHWMIPLPGSHSESKECCSDRRELCSSRLKRNPKHSCHYRVFLLLLAIQLSIVRYLYVLSLLPSQPSKHQAQTKSCRCMSVSSAVTGRACRGWRLRRRCPGRRNTEARRKEKLAAGTGEVHIKPDPGAARKRRYKARHEACGPVRPSGAGIGRPSGE